MKFKIDEKVIIRTYKHMPEDWHRDMFRLMGKTVTIRSNSGYDPDWPYTIIEAPGWVWREKDFIPISVNLNDPNYVFVRRH